MQLPWQQTKSRGPEQHMNAAPREGRCTEAGSLSLQCAFKKAAAACTTSVWDKQMHGSRECSLCLAGAAAGQLQDTVAGNECSLS